MAAKALFALVSQVLLLAIYSLNGAAKLLEAAGVKTIVVALATAPYKWIVPLIGLIELSAAVGLLWQPKRSAAVILALQVAYQLGLNVVSGLASPWCRASPAASCNEAIIARVLISALAVAAILYGTPLASKIPLLAGKAKRAAPKRRAKKE